MTQPIAETASQNPAAATDISIDTIALRHCSFEDHLFELAVIGEAPDGQVDGDAEGARLTARVVSWHSPDGKNGLTRLRVSVTPNLQPSWTATVEMIGVFSCGETPVVPMERFVKNNGVAYLVPYVRERLASLVSASVFKTFILPPLSVAEIMAISNRIENESAAKWLSDGNKTP